MKPAPEEITRRVTVVNITKSLILRIRKTTTVTEEIEIITKED